MSNLMWTPIDIRFKDLLQQFQRHRQFLKDELELQRVKRANEAETAAECERHLAAEERRQANEARLKLKNLSANLQELSNGILTSSTQTGWT
jgi:hypothetical protein